MYAKYFLRKGIDLKRNRKGIDQSPNTLIIPTLNLSFNDHKFLPSFCSDTYFHCLALLKIFFFEVY